MQSLDELRRMIRRVETRRPPRPAAPPAHEVLGGELVETGAGPLLVVRREYPLTHTHGREPLGPAFAAPLDLLSAVARAETPAGNSRGLLFLDTETTGLAGGTGTYTFLVGVGRLDGDRFIVEQYFMRDFDEEPALLAALVPLLRLARGAAARGGLPPQPPRRPLTRRAPRLVRPRPRDARPPGGRGPRRARPSLGTGGSRAGTRVLPGRARRRPRGPHRPPGALAPGALGEARRPVGPGVRALGGRRTSRRVRSGALGGAREVSRASPAGPPHGTHDRLAGARARRPRGRAARSDRRLRAPAVAPGAPSSEARRQDTGVIGGCPSRTATQLRTARVAIAMRVSREALAMCGASTTFWSGTRSGWIFGSSSKTSRPAPAIQPSRRARASTASSTMGPRAAFTRTADFRIRRSVRSPMRCRVSGVRLVWSVTKSASRRSVSRSVAVAESSRSTAASARTASW